MTEAELVKEHLKYFAHIKDGASALPTYLLWAKSEGAAKKAARTIWTQLTPEWRATVRALLED